MQTMKFSTLEFKPAKSPIPFKVNIPACEYFADRPKENPTWIV